MHLKFRVAAAASVALLASACTGGSDGGATSDLAGEGTGDSCTITDPVPVAAALSLTGAGASYGESQQKGLETALAEIEERDGVSYDLAIEDDQSDARQGISVFETLVSDGASVIIGPTLSNTAFQAQPIAQEEGVPVLAISNTAAGITAQGDYVFRNALTEDQVIPQTVEAARAAFDLESVIVMYSNDDAFTESGYEVFDRVLEEQGVEVLDTLSFSKEDTDFRSLLTEARAANPDAIVVSGLIEAAVPLVTQARQLGIDVPIIGGNGFNNPQLITDAGEAAEGVVVGAAWNSGSDIQENVDFLSQFEEQHGAAPDQFAAQAYTGLKLIDQAVRSQCSGNRDDIKAGLGELAEVPTPLGLLTVNEDRDSEHPAVVQVVRDGAFAVLD